jgi:hypothetical protein
MAAWCQRRPWQKARAGGPGRVCSKCHAHAWLWPARSAALFPRLRVVQVPVVHAAGPSARIIGRFFRLAPGWGVFHATYFTHLRPIAGCCRHSTLCCSTAARCAPARGGGMVARGGVTRRGGCCCGKPWIWLSVKRTEIQMQAADAQKTAQLQKTLVLWQVIIIGLAYIQPMTLLDTFGMVSRDSVQHVPTSYLIALVAVLLTSISYGHMIRKYPSSGSAYTYVQKSVHPNAGFMVGWSSLLDYLLSPMVNILLANIYLTDMFLEVNHWVWIIGLSLIMVAVNLRGVRFVANFNSLIVLLQILVIGFFTYLIFSKLSAGQNALGAISVQDGHDGLWSFSFLEPGCRSGQADHGRHHPVFLVHRL